MQKCYLLKTDDKIIAVNFDNAEECAAMDRDPNAREFTAEEYARVAGHENQVGGPETVVTGDQLHNCTISFDINACVLRVTPTWESEGRQERDQLLADTDWAVLPDSPFEPKQAMKDYRQALRDLPATYLDYTKVVWPAKPA